MKYFNKYLRDSKLSKKFFIENVEQIEPHYLKYYSKRKHGLSAMMRVKNEEKWIFYAIMSVLEYVDEIIIVLQNSTDNTKKIIQSINSSKIKIYEYPYETIPVADNYSKHDQHSIYNLAYYYNYALSKTNYSYVWKWDGDQCAIEKRVKKLRELVDENIYDIIHYKGYDIWGNDYKYLCLDPHTSNEPSIFKVTNRTYYFGGKRSEEFTYPVFKNFFKRSKIYNIKEPVFLHFKYATETKGKGWSSNWEKSKYFTEFQNTKVKGEKYNDLYPQIMRDNNLV